MNKRNGLLVQAGILAGAGILVRIIGLLYRSPLTAIIGDEGNGYYGYAYNIYSIALLISSYSIPSAISRLIAAKLAVGEYENAQRYFRCALVYVCTVGGFISLLLLIFPQLFVTDTNAVPVLRMFAPTVFFFGILGVLRGYFQAHRTMTQTSVSQVIEQIVNAFVSITAALIFRSLVKEASSGTKFSSDNGVISAIIRSTLKIAGASEINTKRAVYGAMGSALGTGAGVICALTFFILIYHANRQYLKDRIYLDVHKNIPFRKIMKSLIAYVTPFILSTLVYNMTKLLDQTLFTNVMINVKSISESDVAREFGIFSGKAVVLSEIPIAIAAAVSAAMLPEIASKFARRQKKAARNLCGQVIRVSMIVAIPASVGMAVLSKPVTMLLFPQRATLDKAAALLTILCVTIAWYALSTITNAVLQGVGRVWIPAVNSFFAVCIQGIILYVLLRFTSLYTYALAIAFVIHSVLLCILNQISISRYKLAKISFKEYFLYPLAASAVMGAAAFSIYKAVDLGLGFIIPSEYLVNLIAVIFATVTAVYVYAAVIVRTGMVSEDDIKNLPGGRTLHSLAGKLHILKKEVKHKNNKVRARRRKAQNTNIYSSDDEYYDEEYKYIARNALDEDEEYIQRLKRRKRRNRRNTGSVPGGKGGRSFQGKGKASVPVRRVKRR